MNTAPFLFFDLEGTGPDPDHDRIVEMCFFDATGELLTTRVDPQRPIPKEASEVHGIYDEDVAECELFGAYAEAVQLLVDDAILVGYNIRRYDSILLDRELRMAGQPGLKRDDDGRIVHREVDLYRMWMQLEPRDLATAVKKFAGADLENAHSAQADTEVLPEVLMGMLHAFGLADPSIDDLVELSRPEWEVDRDGKFKRREDGVVVFNIGGSRGQPVHSDPGFLRWMLGKDFSEETLAYARTFLVECFE